jgi:hypothetical protein
MGSCSADLVYTKGPLDRICGGYGGNVAPKGKEKKEHLRMFSIAIHGLFAADLVYAKKNPHLRFVVAMVKMWSSTALCQN